MEADDSLDEKVTAPLSVWIGLIVIAAISFWCQAVVTEERFVPALNVIATEFNIPHDVAGATLMAAGASSPELFSSIVSLFVTHSALGLGTVVGSEIFNQCVICAGAVWAAKSGKLQLDPIILTREVGFYALAILLLYLALQDTRPVDDDPTGKDHIFISFGESFMVFAGYIAYVYVCGNMEAIVMFGKELVSAAASRRHQRVVNAENGTNNNYGAIPPTRYSRLVSITTVERDLPFLQEKTLTQEPVGNFEEVSYYRTKSGDKSFRPQESDSTLDDGSQRTFQKRSSSLIHKSLRGVASALGGAYSDGSSLRKIQFLLATEKPSDEHGLYDVETNQLEERHSCFLWQRSYFYTKARFATHGWQLRWFSFSPSGYQSVPNRSHAKRHRIKYPRFHEIEVDEKRLIVRVLAAEHGKRDFHFMAPSAEILEAIVVKLEEIIETNDRNVNEEEIEQPEEDFDSGDDFDSLIEFPSGGSILEIIAFLVLFPLRFLMTWTIPDVRVLDIQGHHVSNKWLGNRGTAFAAIFSCLLWLIVGSYAMVASLEALADLMDIPDAVVGVTVSAAGTSLPNFVASKVAAEKGFGNMAVSNAFGSNTFNIMIGLGLPWTLYTSFGTGFKPYHGLRNEGILESVIIMAFVLMVFVLIVIQSKCTLYRWHGYLFMAMYLAYLVFAIGQVYW